MPADKKGVDLAQVQSVKTRQCAEDQGPTGIIAHPVGEPDAGAQNGVDPLRNCAAVAGACIAVLPPPGLQHAVSRGAALANEIENLDRGRQPRPWRHGMTSGAMIIPSPAMLPSQTSDRI